MTMIEFRDIEIIHIVFPRNLRTAEAPSWFPEKSFSFCKKKKNYSYYQLKF